MQTLDQDRVTVHMEARPEDIYGLVADVTRMSEFSPEILKCHWLGGATGPAVGVRFVGRNKVSRGPSWTNKPVITDVQPGRRFAFARTEPFGGTIEWAYDFEPEGSGTRVTESYRTTRPITRIGWFIIGTLFGCKDRRAELRDGMEKTLERMRAAVERNASAA